MRLILCLALCLPAAAQSETFILRSTPKSVIVYPQGAQVRRFLDVAIPAGRHDIILPDLPQEAGHHVPQVAVSGATLELVTLREDALPPLPQADPQTLLRAREAVKSRQAALNRHLDEEATVRLQSDAAASRIAFLKGLSQNESLPADSTGLSSIAEMIGTQTLAARQQMLSAEQIIRDMGEARDALEKDLRAAQDALAALETAEEGRVQATLVLSSDVDTTAQISVTYFVSARWTQLYDVFLDQTEPAQLRIKRGASVTQQSGEDWQGVSMTLSTLQPSERTAPSVINPQRLRIFDPVKTAPDLARSSSLSQVLDGMTVEAPLIIEEPEAFATSRFEGPGVSYVPPTPVNVSNGVDAARIALDTLTFEAEDFARAVPLRDETAFLMARFTNTAPEPLFDATGVLYYLDNVLVGVGAMPNIPAGAQGELSFGPIESLLLERVVLNRTDGDRGLISRSNTRNEEVRITLENLGPEAWQVELLDRVPFSEQDDLTVSYTATPPADVQDVDDQRGILQWNLDLQAGTTQDVVLRQDIRWPEGKSLR